MVYAAAAKQNRILLEHIPRGMPSIVCLDEIEQLDAAIRGSVLGRLDFSSSSTINQSSQQHPK